MVGYSGRKLNSKEINDLIAQTPEDLSVSVGEKLYFIDFTAHGLSCIDSRNYLYKIPLFLHFPYMIFATQDMLFVCCSPTEQIESEYIAVLSTDGERIGSIVELKYSELIPKRCNGHYAEHFDTEEKLEDIPLVPFPVKSLRENNGKLLILMNDGIEVTIPLESFYRERYDIEYSSLCYKKIKNVIKAVLSEDEYFCYSYDIMVNSYADSENTKSIDEYNSSKYENNIAFTIENEGQSSITINSIAVNDRNYFDIDSIVKYIIKDAETQEEKLLKIWNYLRKFMIRGVTWSNQRPESPNFSVTRFLNGFSSGACGTFNSVFVKLASFLGIPARTIGFSNYSHIGAEFQCDDRNLFIDALYGNSYLGNDFKGAFCRNNQGEIASYKEICEDHNLMVRAGTFEIGELASLFGYADNFSSDFQQGYQDKVNTAIRLNPNENIIISWDFQGEFTGYRRPTAGIVNGRKVMSGKGLSPDVCSDIFNINGIIKVDNDPKTSNIRFSTQSNSIIEIPFSSSYPITSLELNGYVTDSIIIECNLENSTESTQFSINAGYFILDINKSKMDFGANLPNYSGKIRLLLPEKAAILFDKLTINFQANRIALPYLEKGKNRVCIKGNSSKDIHLIIDHKWRESDSPDIISTTIPVSMVEIDENLIFDMNYFSWSRIFDAQEYEFMLSDKEACDITYLPIYNTVLTEPNYPIDNYRFLIPGKKYYWKVRAKVRGVWQDYSDITEFIWDAPDIPLNPRLVRSDRKLSICWDENTSECPIEYYEVYGSNEKGFNPSEKPFLAYAKKNREPVFATLQPGNLLATVHHTDYEITSQLPSWKIPAYIRIVGVDVRGRRSMPSQQVELPVPFLLVNSVTKTAFCNVEYTCFPKTIVSFGSCHFNRLEGKEQFTTYLNSSKVIYEKTDGPEWLSVRYYDGYLSGTPSEHHRGINRFKIRLSDQFNRIDEVEILINVL